MTADRDAGDAVRPVRAGGLSTKLQQGNSAAASVVS